MYQEIIQGLSVPFIGTTAGAAMVFILRGSMTVRLQKILTGFAAGVMTAASFWSLLAPAIEQAEYLGKLAFLPAAIGFMIGVGFLLLLDYITPHMHMDQVEEGPRTGLKRTTKLILAVTLHNIPEGMAVGVVYAGWLYGDNQITAAAAFALALGNCHPELPGGSHCCHAPSGRGDGEDKDLHLWDSLRHRRAYCRADYPCRGRLCGSGDALSAQFRRGGYDLCRCRGTDSGDVRGRTLQSGDGLLLPGFCTHDDS